MLPRSTIPGDNWGNSILTEQRKKQIVESCDKLHQELANKTPEQINKNIKIIAEHLSQLFDNAGNIRYSAIYNSSLTTDDLLQLHSAITMTPQNGNILINFNIDTDNRNISNTIRGAAVHLMPDKINEVFNRLAEQLDHILKSDLIGDERTRNTLQDAYNGILENYDKYVLSNMDSNYTRNLEGLLRHYQGLEKQFSPFFERFKQEEKNIKSVDDEVNRLYDEALKEDKIKAQQNQAWAKVEAVLKAEEAKLSQKKQPEVAEKPKATADDKRKHFKEAGKQKGKVIVKPEADPTPKAEQDKVQLKKPLPEARGSQINPVFANRAGKIGTYTDPQKPKAPVATHADLQKARESINDQRMPVAPNNKRTPSGK